MSVKLPYYSSLNSQMAEYYKQIKLQEYNNVYQQAQLDIVLEGERNLASQAEIMNRLTQLQQEIANQAAQTLIPLSATKVSEAPAVEEQKFPGMTAAEYESKIKRQPQGTAAEKPKRQAEKRQEKKISPKNSAENTPTLLSPTSTEATFQQSSMGSPEKKKEKKTLTGKTIKEINTEFAKIKSPVKIENFEIRVENGKPIYKDLNSGQDIQKPTAQLVQRLYNQYKIQTGGSGIKRKSQPRNPRGQFIKKT